MLPGRCSNREGANVAAPAWVNTLPTVNASLNGSATVLLAAGYLLIRRGHVAGHKRIMLLAFAVSILFLVCYLVYHFALHIGDVASVRQGPANSGLCSIPRLYTSHPILFMDEGHFVPVDTTDIVKAWLDGELNFPSTWLFQKKRSRTPRGPENTCVSPQGVP